MARLPYRGALKPAGQEPNREHGADDPIGAKTVTAPATVSGEVERSNATGKPGRPHPTAKPQVRIPAATNRGNSPTQLEHTEGVLLMTSNNISIATFSLSE